MIEDGGGPSMVKKAWRLEFEQAGREAVKENVSQGRYGGGEKRAGAMEWLEREDPERIARQATENTLKLAQRMARRIRIIMNLAAAAVVLLFLAIYMLWRVLERLPHTIPSSG
jgi:hypothetical protein